MWEVCRRWEEFQGELPSEEDEELHFTVELKQVEAWPTINRLSQLRAQLLNLGIDLNLESKGGDGDG